MLDGFWLFVSSDSYWAGVFSGVILGLTTGTLAILGGLLLKEASGELLESDIDIVPPRSSHPAGSSEDEPDRE